MKKHKKEKNSGITLIALVVTIIVLLILAGISISMLSGDNGILQRATDAKIKTERQSIVEQARTDVLGYQAENKGGNLEKAQLKSVLVKYFKDVPSQLPDGNELSNLKLTTLDKYGTHTIIVSEIYNGTLTTVGSGELPKGPNGKPLINQETISQITTGKIIGEDKLGNQIVIPEGFKLAQGEHGSGDTVKTGIVIEDDEGNQYVWIPVSNINHDGSNKIKIDSIDEEGVEITLGRYSWGGAVPSTSEGKFQYGIDYTQSIILEYYQQELSSYRTSNYLDDSTGTNTTAKNLKQFVESVRDNKGYYMARYEASYRISGKVGSIVSTSTAEVLELSSPPATRAEGNLWNFVKQGEAALACQDLYTTVNSDLMNSYSWDTAILYIQEMGNDRYSYARKKDGATLKNTGTTGDEKCKIFDMSANLTEWTTLSGTNSSGNVTYSFSCAHVGGSYDDYASTYSKTSRKATYSDKLTTFRPILYL